MFLLILFTTLLSSKIIVAREEWIDPHAMHARPFKQASEDGNCNCLNDVASTFEYNCPAPPINIAVSHYKRIINMLLAAVIVDRSDLSSYKGYFSINIPVDDYDLLKSFAKHDAEDSNTFRSIDKILSKIFTKPSHQHLMNNLISWTDQIYFTFYNRTSAVLLTCLFVLFISYKLLRANLTLWSITKYLIFLGWVIDFAFTWISLLQDAEINKMADSLRYTIPPECDPNKMSTFQYIKYFFGMDSYCREYHQTLLRDNFWSIGPVMVLSHQLGVVILTPAMHVGSALGNFTNGILRTLPFGVNVMLLPLLLTFAAIIICILLSFLTETSFKFSLFYGLQLEFGNKQRQVVGDMLSGRNLSAIINAMHRNMVEDVRQVATTENTVRSADSDFRETSDDNVSTIKSKSASHDTNDDNVKSVCNCPSTHDGSGDKIESVN